MPPGALLSTPGAAPPGGPSALASGPLGSSTTAPEPPRGAARALDDPPGAAAEPREDRDAAPEAPREPREALECPPLRRYPSRGGHSTAPPGRHRGERGSRVPAGG